MNQARVLIVKKLKDITEDDAVKFDIIFIKKPNGWYTTAKNKFDPILKDKSRVEVGKFKKDGRYTVEER
jgi:hypothetical protein